MWIFLLVPVLGGLIYFLYQQAAANRERELERQLEQIRKAGKPEAAAEAVELMAARAKADADNWRRHSWRRP